MYIMPHWFTRGVTLIGNLFSSGLQQNGQSKPKDKDRLFDRIADSFVALFTSIHPEIKDKFFQVMITDYDLK